MIVYAVGATSSALITGRLIQKYVPSIMTKYSQYQICLLK